MAILLGLTIGSKGILLAICATLSHVSDVAKTLALDHLNDVLSNTVALGAALLASWRHAQLWWTDAVGAIVVSLYIIWSWLGLANEQIGRLVGMGAPDSFVQVVFPLVVLCYPTLYSLLFIIHLCFIIFYFFSQVGLHILTPCCCIHYTVHDTSCTHHPPHTEYI